MKCGWKILPVLLVVPFMIQGCKLVEKEDRIADVDFTVVCPEEVPEELAEEIANIKEKEFQLSYEDGEYLYVAKGYGTQKTSGYSISVADMYETEHTLIVDTEISGPSEGEDVVHQETMPFIVIKTEIVEKQIIFQ